MSITSLFLLGIVAEIVIRSPYNRLRQQNRVTTDRVTDQEKILLGLLLLGMFVLPMIYIFTELARRAGQSAGVYPLL